MMTRPEVRLARRLVEDLNLEPPVDVRGLLQEHARLEEVRFPVASSCDAVITGLHAGKRPTVFVNTRPSRWRQRFTLGHELGHLHLGWHVATEVCVTQGEDEDGLYPDELEADRFASEILLPRRFLEVVRDSSADVGAMLEGVEVAEVSAPAAMRALVQVLPAGHAIVKTDGRGLVTHRAQSAGTLMPIPYPRHRLDWNAHQATADEAGTCRFNGQRLFWWHVDPGAPLIDNTTDTRGASEILTGILTDTLPYEVHQRVRQRMSGISGYAVNDADVVDPVELAAALRQRFAGRSDLVDVVRHEDFPLWLARKVQEIALRRSTN